MATEKPNFNWTNKVDGQDDILAEDVNILATMAQSGIDLGHQANKRIDELPAIDETIEEIKNYVDEALENKTDTDLSNITDEGLINITERTFINGNSYNVEEPVEIKKGHTVVCCVITFLDYNGDVRRVTPNSYGVSDVKLAFYQNGNQIIINGLTSLPWTIPDNTFFAPANCSIIYEDTRYMCESAVLTINPTDQIATISDIEEALSKFLNVSEVGQ